MASIRYQPDDQAIEARPGDVLLDAAIEQGLPIPFGCQSAKCGVCRVEVLAGQPDGLEEPSELEQGTLEAFGCEPNVRLACQAVVKGDVEIRSAS